MQRVFRRSDSVTWSRRKNGFLYTCISQKWSGLLGWTIEYVIFSGVKCVFTSE